MLTLKRPKRVCLTKTTQMMTQMTYESNEESETDDENENPDSPFWASIKKQADVKYRNLYCRDREVARKHVAPDRSHSPILDLSVNFSGTSEDSSSMLLNSNGKNNRQSKPRNITSTPVHQSPIGICRRETPLDSTVRRNSSIKHFRESDCMDISYKRNAPIISRLSRISAVKAPYLEQLDNSRSFNQLEEKEQTFASRRMSTMPQRMAESIYCQSPYASPLNDNSLPTVKKARTRHSRLTLMKSFSNTTTQTSKNNTPINHELRNLIVDTTTQTSNTTPEVRGSRASIYADLSGQECFQEDDPSPGRRPESETERLADDHVRSFNHNRDNLNINISSACPNSDKLIMIQKRKRSHSSNNYSKDLNNSKLRKSNTGTPVSRKSSTTKKMARAEIMNDSVFALSDEINSLSVVNDAITQNRSSRSSNRSKNVSDLPITSLNISTSEERNSSIPSQITIETNGPDSEKSFDSSVSKANGRKNSKGNRSVRKGKTVDLSINEEIIEKNLLSVETSKTPTISQSNTTKRNSSANNEMLCQDLMNEIVSEVNDRCDNIGPMNSTRIEMFPNIESNSHTSQQISSSINESAICDSEDQSIFSEENVKKNNVIISENHTSLVVQLNVPNSSESPLNLIENDIQQDISTSQKDNLIENDIVEDVQTNQPETEKQCIEVDDANKIIDDSLIIEKSNQWNRSLDLVFEDDDDDDENSNTMFRNSAEKAELNIESNNYVHTISQHENSNHTAISEPNCSIVPKDIEMHNDPLVDEIISKEHETVNPRLSNAGDRSGINQKTNQSFNNRYDRDISNQSNTSNYDAISNPNISFIQEDADIQNDHISENGNNSISEALKLKMREDEPPVAVKKAKKISTKRIKARVQETQDFNQTRPIIKPNVSEDTCIRRSKRTRTTPCEYWRGERVRYARDSTGICFKIDGVVKGALPFNGKKSIIPKTDKPKSRITKPEKMIQQKSEVTREVRKSFSADLSIHDSNAKELMSNNAKNLSQVKKHNTIRDGKDLVWKPSALSNDVLMAILYKNKEQKSANGLLKIAGDGEKPLQQTGDYMTDFIVMYGAISLLIADGPPVILKSGASFRVDRKVFYSMKNLRKDTAHLQFIVVNA